MDFNNYLNDMEEEDYTPEDYNASGDSRMRAGSSGRNTLTEDKRHGQHLGKIPQQKEYSNDEVDKFINFLGFKAEQVPNFTEMAKKLNPQIKHEVVKKDLTTLNEHEANHDVKYHKDEKQIKREALQRLIAKYRG